MVTISPGQNDIRTALRLFMLTVMPTDFDAVIAQQNRVAQPKQPNFAVISFLRFDRLRTNVDTDQDVKFTGSILGTALTVTAIDFGEIKIGATLFGEDVEAGTRIVSGAGMSWVVSESQNLSSRVLSSGAKQLEQAVDCVMQIDFHSADPGSSDLVQIFSTAFRDAYAADWFRANYPGIGPLYAENPRQAPFINGESQYEWRWMVEAHLQVDQKIALPKQFADVVEVDVISVEAEFPDA